MARMIAEIVEDSKISQEIRSRYADGAGFAFEFTAAATQDRGEVSLQILLAR